MNWGKRLDAPSGSRPRRSTDRPFVFLNTEPRHRAIAAEIRAAIGDRAAWAEPLRAGTAEEVRIDFEQCLMDCDAMVMVYDVTSVGHARSCAPLPNWRRDASIRCGQSR
jgi:hypothetical protein